MSNVVSRAPLLILGGGFTGCAVARAVGEAHPLRVATTRSEARATTLRAAGATPWIVPRLDAEAVRACLERLGPDTRVVVTIPPDAGLDRALADAVGEAHVTVYVSSTAVYGAAVGDVDAQTPVHADGPRAALRIEAERCWLGSRATVVRAPGIYGPGRGLHLRLAREEVRLAEGPSGMVSRVHVDDLARIVAASLAQATRGEVLVAGDRAPAPLAEVVEWICATIGISTPTPIAGLTLDESLRHDRRVVSDAMLARLGLALRYPTYVDGYRQAIDHDRDLVREAISARSP